MSGLDLIDQASPASSCKVLKYPYQVFHDAPLQTNWCMPWVPWAEIWMFEKALCTKATCELSLGSAVMQNRPTCMAAWGNVSLPRDSF